MSSPWEFDSEPTPNQIQSLLVQVPAWIGSDKTMADFQEYVVPIPSKQTGKWRLYTTVNGKLRIMREAHIVNGEIMPVHENVTIEWKTNIVVVSGTMESHYGKVFEAATAMIGDGVRGADRTNPVENALTSWRGRACSALCGAGLLPYSGIASAEEVQDYQNRVALEEKGVRIITPTQLNVDSEDESDNNVVEQKKTVTEVKKGVYQPGERESAMKANIIETTRKKLGDSFDDVALAVANELNIDISSGLINLPMSTLVQLINAILKNR